MDTGQILLGVVMAWCLLGVSTALVMGRRGHAPFMWLVLAVVFGPLVLPLAANALYHDRPGMLRRLSAGLPGHGSVDVLVGIDGSEAAVNALRSVIEVLGDRIGRLTLAAVVDYDVAMGSELAEERDRAEAHLLRAAEATELVPGTIVLSGRPAEALSKQAVEEGYELLAVGRRGRGASRTLLGSVATELAHGGDVPVLIV